MKEIQPHPSTTIKYADQSEDDAIDGNKIKLIDVIVDGESTPADPSFKTYFESVDKMLKHLREQ